MPEDSSSDSAEVANSGPCSDSIEGANLDISNDSTVDARLDTQRVSSDPLVQFGNVKGAISNMVGTAAARCGFLAGFSYYELSRLSADNATRVPGYPLCLLGCFTFSVVCGALWAFIEMHKMKVDPESLGLSTDRRLRGIASAAYNSYKASFFLYVAALSQMVEVFNETAIEKSPKWGEFWYVLFTFERFYLLVFIVGLLSVEYRFNRISYRIRGEREKNPEGYCVESVIQMANKFGNRALLMVGFIQHAVARYNYIPTGPHHVRADAGGQRSADIWLNALFWHAIILSCGCLLIVVFLSSLIAVCLQAVPSSPTYLRDFYLCEVRWTWRVCRTSFVVGLYLVLVGAAMTGWGCSGQCELKDVPGGACYADVAYVPAVMCSISLLTIFTVEMYARYIATQTRAAARQARRDQSLAMESVSSTFAEANERTMAVLGYIGNSSTIAAGFVMYNITTFDTDVIHAPYVRQDVNFGLTKWGYSFLWANWIAFALGVAVAMSVLCVELQFVRLQSEIERHTFLIKIRLKVSCLCGVLFTCAITAFIVSFGLFGLTKMDTVRLEPAIVSIIGIVSIFVEMVYVTLHFRRASQLKSSKSSAGLDVEGVHVSHELQLHQLQASSSRALLFGGFAYNAVNFLFRSSAALSPLYTVGMGLSFTSAMYATLCEGIINVYTTNLKNDFQKNNFVWRISATVKRLHFASVAYLVCFLGSFTVMGYIKLWRYDTPDETDEIALSWRYGWMPLLGGVIALVVIFQRMVSTQRSARKIQEMNPAALSRSHSDLSSSLPSRCSHPWKTHQNALNIRADAVVFQTGNVFYEILFSAVGMNQIANYAYFSLSVVTLVLGAVVVTISALLSVWGDSIQERDAGLSIEWVRKTRNSQRLLEILYTMSLYSWMFAMLFSSAVKYPRLWYASASWSAIGLLLITFGAVHMRLVWKSSEGKGARSETKKVSSLPFNSASP